MHILLIEPWFEGSHQAWAAGYARHSRHQVTIVSHDGWSWRWRLDGAAVTLAADTERAVATAGPPDVVLASGMMNLAAYLGMARRHLGDVPVALYLHENQLTYPTSEHTEAGYGIVNWISAAAADRILFNSDYHRESFFAALPALLDQAGDHPHHDFLDGVRARSEVLPVGVDLARLDGIKAGTPNDPPAVLWNHRWEYDKDPAAFVVATEKAAAAGLDFELLLAGRRVGASPEAERLEKEMAARVGYSGHADEGHYRELLARADIVMSTARQEFFGISVVEAMYAGALPLLPRRLVYPELIPADLHDVCLYDDPAEALIAAISSHPVPDVVTQRLRAAVAPFDWPLLAPEYDALLEDLI